MALLPKTESRLPSIFVQKLEDGGTTYFNAQNAALLGYNMFDLGVCLVSYLPPVVRSVQVTGNLQNHYTLFVDKAAGTELELSWKVRFFIEPEEEPEEGEEPPESDGDRSPTNQQATPNGDPTDIANDQGYGK